MISSVKAKAMFLAMMLLLFLPVMSGCNCGIDQSSPVVVANHSVTVIPGGPRSLQHNPIDNSDEYECGATNVRIKDGRLIVNYKSYGTLAPNAVIVVNNGIVSVDGNIVQGQALSQQDRQSSSVYETRTNLNGHVVIVRPGAPSSLSITKSTDQFNYCKYTMTAGNFTIVIEDGHQTVEGETYEVLTVDGVNYGTLNFGDNILVDSGVVNVNGSLRQATN
jgi:hypothetical protein